MEDLEKPEGAKGNEEPNVLEKPEVKRSRNLGKPRGSRKIKKEQREDNRRTRGLLKPEELKGERRAECG
ncbi:hypothetical protein ACT7DH_03785 [Bacillus pacificus]